MKRTYRSKKGTSGALDHKDVLLNMDEKSSAFDAFYIQNLKQTKRELSCVGSSNHVAIASNKVRKRKYVKRLVKEVEPVCHSERLTTSTYLTPDKSIRVNKILDPFDMLLNSSPVRQESEAKIIKTFVPKKETKTYVRKRKPKIKKCNYSSTSTESDKENTINSNVTDIRTHELLVEKVSHSPKSIDESIIKIVSNLSLINNLKWKGTNGCFNTSYKTRNRLRKNFQPPMMQKSPLCSTPCKEKYRGMSIFKFSPITQKEQMSPAFQEKDDSGIILVSKSLHQKSYKNHKVSSPALKLLKPNKTNLSVNDNENNTSTTAPEFQSQNDIEVINYQKENVNNNSVINNEQSACQVTEIEPFLGFTITNAHDVTKETIESMITSLENQPMQDIDLVESELASNRIDCTDSFNVNIDQSDLRTNKSDNDNSIPNNDTDQIKSGKKNEMNEAQRSNSALNVDKNTYTSKSRNPNYSTSNNDTKGNDSDSESLSLNIGIDKNESEANKNDSFNSSSEVDIDENGLESNYTSNNESKSTANSSIASNKRNTSDSANNNQSSDSETLYDTCDSDQSSITDDNETSNEPIIVIERMNDSIFQKYIEKMLKPEEECYTDQRSTEDEKTPGVKINDSLFLKYNDKILKLYDKEISEQSDDEDFESLANNSNDVVNEINCENYDTDEIKAPIVITDSSTTDDVISNEECDDDEELSEKDDRYVSFVTTRRRLEITNDSMFQFDQSYGSSSTDCDKTVISNKLTINKTNNFSYENTPKDDSKGKYLDVKENYEDIKTDSTQDKIDSRVSNAKLRFLNESNVVSSLPNYYNYENSDDENISRMNTQRGSKFSRQSTTSSISKSRPSNSSSIKTISRISTRKLSQPAHALENHSGNEMTPKNSFEMNKIIENDSLDKDTNVLNNRDSISLLSAENSSYMLKENVVSHSERGSYAESEIKPVIVLQPGKKWERSLSIYRRMTMVADHFEQSILEDDCKGNKGRKYRQSVISTMEMQEQRDSLHNDSVNSRRSTFVSNPGRPTIRFVKDPNFSRVSLNTSSVFDDLKGFLSEECDDTVIELSKLSIADSEREVTILDNFHETERVTTARDYVLRRCNQTEPILFDECYPETVLKNCHKIGEGVYGEVFLWRGRDGRARVMKIVPIAGAVKVNGEQQKDFHEIISEIVIAMELSALRAPIADIARQLDEGDDIHALDLHAIQNATDTFNEVLAVRCVHGPYPSRLLDLWELYDECKGSENDNPASLPADQRYIVLELANAGQDLESYQFASAQQAHALFQQIAFGLAVAEEAFQFEHRDLHWGNVLIAPTEQKFATFVLRGRTYRVLRRGVAATVIDYSLSRLTLPLAADCAALYNDLAADEQLFDAVGDYQFELYRLMREKLGNDWKNFEPYTNILWLHYTVDKMITALRYKRTNTKIHKHYIEKLKGIKNSILEYGSAVQYVLTDIDF